MNLTSDENAIDAINGFLTKGNATDAKVKQHYKHILKLKVLMSLMKSIIIHTLMRIIIMLIVIIYYYIV